MEEIWFLVCHYAHPHTGVEIDAAPLGSYKSVTQIGTQTGITSPFAGPKSSADSAASDNSDQPMLKSLGSRQSFIRSATTGAIPGKGLYPEIREAPKEGSPFSSKPPQLNTSKANRAQSSRRQIPEPGSPGSDQDPDPPRTRQDARPIFGGIAKQFRGQTGTPFVPTHFHYAEMCLPKKPQKYCILF